ncbi:hypothetical protein C6P46_001771 [Rhodotorula mucilaginosa]|uniref:Uncharacterized protein n=1 Tax=Rhodotorula mucilaginosa TaxID=5537 RepID=A0A9P6VUS8_RHOMI|nr:hypothetical protein C6P46_001771 [Rhodotorula mucilaginosa]
MDLAARGRHQGLTAESRHWPNRPPQPPTRFPNPQAHQPRLMAGRHEKTTAGSLQHHRQQRAQVEIREASRGSTGLLQSGGLGEVGSVRHHDASLRKRTERRAAASRRNCPDKQWRPSSNKPSIRAFQPAPDPTDARHDLKQVRQASSNKPHGPESGGKGALTEAKQSGGPALPMGLSPRTRTSRSATADFAQVRPTRLLVTHTRDKPASSSSKTASKSCFTAPPRDASALVSEAFVSEDLLQRRLAL